MNDLFKLQTKLMYFGLNYPHDFIEKAFADKPNIATHLKQKFINFYNEVGSYGVFSKFFTSLDNENQIQLLTWINENYKG